jgi:coenzyme F420 hydrogenase subunit delta
VLEELLVKPVVVFGCGNTLLGDDGFGPEVIDHLKSHYRLPDHCAAMDIGTSICDYLFDFILLPVKPTHIFIVDAISHPQRNAGEIFELNLEDLPKHKSSGFSLHQFPSVNLLQELQQSVKVRILAVQVKEIPEVVRPGLSREVREAIPKACEWLIREISGLSP